MFTHGPRRLSALLTLLALLSLLACQGEPTIGTLVHEDAARPRPRALQEPAADETLVAVDAAGVVRFVDAASFEVRLGARAGEEGAAPVDISVFAEDGELRRLAVVTQSDPEADSDVWVFPFTGAVFARPRVVRGYAGQVRALALEEGALLFQRGEAWEWNLIPAGDERPRSKQGPIPTSILAVEDHDGASHVLALARSADDEPVLVRGVVEGSTLAGCEVSPLALELSEAARVVRLGAVDVVVDAHASALSVGALAGAAPLAQTSTPIGRIEAAIPLELGGELGVAVLSSEPPAVTVVWLELAGELSVKAVASHPLQADVEQVYATFQRGLAFASERLFVATTRGLEAFEVAPPPAASLAALELPGPLAALRGPLASAPSLEGEETEQE